MIWKDLPEELMLKLSLRQWIEVVRIRRLPSLLKVTGRLVFKELAMARQIQHTRDTWTGLSAGLGSDQEELMWHIGSSCFVWYTTGTHKSILHLFLKSDQNLISLSTGELV